MWKRGTIGFDELLRESIEELYEEELSKIPPREELEKQIQLSDEFKLEMAQLSKEVDRQQAKRRKFQFWKQVAVVTLVCAGVAGTLILTDEEVGAKLKQFISENQDTYVDVEIDGTGENQSAEKYIIGYLPEGYVANEEVPVIRYRNSIKYVYENVEKEYFYISIITDDYKANMDNEHQMKQEMMVNGNPAEFYESTSPEIKSHLVYENQEEKVVIQIDGNISKEEMVKVAESISKGE